MCADGGDGYYSTSRTMHALVKMVCDRCFAMYRAELEAEGWSGEVPAPPPLEGICSICGRVEGHRTVQLRASEVAARFAGIPEPGGKADDE